MPDGSRDTSLSFDPAAEMRRLQQEIDSLFDEVQDELERRRGLVDDAGEVEVSLSSARSAIRQVQAVLDAMQTDLEHIDITASEVGTSYRGALEV